MMEDHKEGLDLFDDDESYSEEDIALLLQSRIDACENEIRVLRAQIRSQQVLLDHFQADAPRVLTVTATVAPPVSPSRSRSTPS